MDVKEYFSCIFRETYNRVFGYTVSKCFDIHDAEDIVQEVYSELYMTLEKKGGGYIENYNAFVILLAKRKLISYYKGRKKLKMIAELSERNEFYTGSGGEIDEFDIEERYARQETIDEIWLILKTKPLDVQKIFMLYYYCDIKLKQIAALMRLTESNVKHKLYRTLEEIRQLYK